MTPIAAGTITVHAAEATSNATPCAVAPSDIEYAAIDDQGRQGAWTPATTVTRFTAEPGGGLAVRISPGASPAPGCTSTISAASYAADGPAWATSGQQRFIAATHITLDDTHPGSTLKVFAPRGSAGAPCYAQFDFYFGDTVFDGLVGTGHGPLPRYPDVLTPTGLIAMWNGTSSECASPPPPTGTVSHSPSKPSTATSSSPPTPRSSTGTPSWPATPASPTRPAPSTPTPSVTPTGHLAKTGASFAGTALLSLAFLGAGSGVLFATRRIRSRRH